MNSDLGVNMRNYLLLIIFLYSFAFAQDYKSLEDFDGDGLDDDKYPLLAESPHFFWEINELIFAWDVDLELLTQSEKEIAQKEFRESSFSFGSLKAHQYGLEGELPLTLNIFKLFTNAKLKIQGGLHNLGYSKWNASEQKKIETCIKSFERQKTLIKNPHWEITVWFTNNTKNTIIAKNVKIPLLDARENVLTYAFPYTDEKFSSFTIPPLRRLPIRFRAETNTDKALSELNNIKDFMPIFSIYTSETTLNEETNLGEIDLISKMLFMEQKTIPIIFECDEIRLSWRVARFDKDGKAMTLEKAIFEIGERLKNISESSFSEKPFLVLENDEISSLAGYSNTKDKKWKIFTENNKEIEIKDAINQTVLFRYEEIHKTDISPLTKKLPSAQETTLEEYNFVTKGYKFQIEHGLAMKRGYFLTDFKEWSMTLFDKDSKKWYQRQIALKGFFRENKTSPNALMLIYSNITNNITHFFCIPSYNSSKEIWDMSLNNIREKLPEKTSVDAMRTITYVLMRELSYILTFKNTFSLTTDEEYKYLTTGIKIQIDSGLDMKSGYQLKKVDIWSLIYSNEEKNQFKRSTEFQLLYREKDQSICGILVIYRRTDNGHISYYCIPHYSQENFWKEIEQELSNDEGNYHALLARSWALMKFISLFSKDL